MPSSLQPAPGADLTPNARASSARPDSPPVPPQELYGADADLFDYPKLRDYLGFVLHSVGRRWMTALAVFASTVSAAVLALSVLPKTYHCEVKIQAQRNLVINTLTGISRAWDWELPSRAAGDLILRHDNLVSLVRKTDLVHSFERSRAPLLRLKDALMKRLESELPDDVKEDVMIGTLEQKLSVQTGEDTVTIAVDWPEATAAYRLIQAAHENFLESRQYKEVSAISEAIGLLQGRALDSREKVHAALERVQVLRGPAKSAARKPKPVARPPARRPVDGDLQRLRGQLRSKQQVIFEMEDFRRRRIADLSSKLGELKQTFSEFHPAVIDLQQSLQQQEREENPQLSLLRQEFRQLEDQYERRGGPALESTESDSSGQLTVEALRIGRAMGDELESPDVEQAKTDLKYELGRYSSLAEKIDQVKTELEAQRAAFHYRYGVLRPAAMPKSPSKPSKKFVLAAAGAMGLLLAILAALLRDVRSRRILERWQVERQLGVAVIGEVQAP
jgi:uncharacterized protein involved in exopolysaccharide biosynthesis